MQTSGTTPVGLLGGMSIVLVQQKYKRPCLRHDYGLLPRHPVRVVSWNAKDVNTAGLIRTAEAFRLERVTFLRKPRTLTPAVGADHWQDWDTKVDLTNVIELAKEDGYTIVALEQTTDSVPLHQANLPERMCLVCGDEGAGVPPKVLVLCDMAVEIRQYGFVGSLNVVTAASIALYEWTRQHGS